MLYKSRVKFSSWLTPTTKKINLKIFYSELFVFMIMTQMYVLNIGILYVCKLIFIYRSYEFLFINNIVFIKSRCSYHKSVQMCDLQTFNVMCLLTYCLNSFLLSVRSWRNLYTIEVGLYISSIFSFLVLVVNSFELKLSMVPLYKVYVSCIQIFSSFKEDNIRRW